jgi:hypothetical protein
MVFPQYVNVASNQREVMLLGGNLPDSMRKYAIIGHHGEDEENPPSSKEENLKTAS